MPGKLFTWGRASFGRLGNGTTTPDVLVPVQIGSGTDWDMISTSYFSWANQSIRNGGERWAWGANGTRQLGDGSSTTRSSPVKIGNETDWDWVSMGNEYAMGIRNGALYGWGYNVNGQCGNGTTTNVSNPTQIGSDTNWAKIVCAQSHTIAIKTDGTLWSWGSNANGRTGQNTTSGNTTSPTQIGSDNNWTEIAVGEGHCLAIKSTGTLWSWGAAASGVLGNGTTTPDVLVPTQVGNDTNWSKVAAGDSHSFSIKTTGTLWAWGLNTNGKLGDGSTTQRTSPVQIGSATTWTKIAAGGSHSLGIRDGNLYTWGNPANGRLGNNTTTGNVTSPTQIGVSSDWIEVSAGGEHSIALQSSTVLPANTVAPAVTGTAKVGQTLTTTDGTWTGTPTPTYTRQWQVSDNGTTGWSNISGATSSNYTITSSEAGKYIRSRITATNDAGSVEAFSSATAQITENAVVSTPTITGTAKVGNTLTASATATAGFPSPTITYQWQYSTDNESTWNNLSGATNTTFELTDNQAGQKIRVQATATNSENSDTKSSTATSAVLQNVSNITLPESFGYPLVGELFTTSNGTWKGYPLPTYTYQWQSSIDGLSWSNISGATSSSYTVTNNEAGKFIRALVTATNSESSESEISNSNGPINQLPEISAVTIDGLPAKVGEELTATAAATAGYPEPVITYEWYRDNEGFEYIDDGAIYTPTSVDAGLTLKVVATATNIEGSDSSDQTTEETLWTPANTSLPTINYPEFLEVGETLTADPGIWTGYPDPAEIGFTYQWQVSDDGENDWTNIEDATATTLYLGTEFGTKYVRVEVTSTTTAGSTTVYSAETGYISEDPSIIVSPILSGTPHYQETLTVDPGEWGGFPEADFEYSWEISLDGSEDWETLDGEEEDTITLSAETVGYYIRVYVTGTNPVGSASVHSNVLGPILRAAYLLDDPTITGDPRLLNTIETDDGSFGGFEEPTISYSWELSDDETIWEEIDEANNSSYIIPDDEDLIGKFIRSKVTATNTVGFDTGYSNSLGPIDYPLQVPAFTTNPTLNIQYGIPSVDIEIESSYEGSGYPIPTPTYQWQIRPGALDPWENITGATMATYTPIQSDINKQLRLRVTLTNIAGTVTEFSAATFNVVPEFKEPSLVEPGVISTEAYINKLIKLIDFGEVDGYPIPVLELDSIEFEYSFNSDSENPEWKTVNNFDTGDTEWLVSEDFAQAKIRAKITYSVPTGIFDDIVIYTNLSGEIIEQPYQQETFLPMANAKLNKIYSNPEVTGVPHDSEFLPTYTEKRIKWEGQSDAFIRTKMLKLINASTSVGGGTIDRYKETVVIIPKLTNIDHDDYINLTYDDKEYTWKVIEITDGNYDLGMPEIYRLVVEKA